MTNMIVGLTAIATIPCLLLWGAMYLHFCQMDAIERVSREQE